MKNHRTGIAALAALALAGCTATSNQPAPGSAAEALRPYYASLAGDLPQANPGPAIDRSRAISRIGFGSCNHQHRHQTIWPVIADHNPELFLMIGDNVYGDYDYRGEADLRTFEQAYGLQASHPEFIAFRERVPMLASWDDHDFGPNDSGGTFAFREHSEDLFESFWRSSAEVRGRPGIYDSVTIGPDGQLIQIIMLDTRFFRDPLTSLPYSYDRRPLGYYGTVDDPGATLLGAAQWAWLAEELAEPADLRLIVSSIQVLTDAHNWEKWGNMPHERQRLYEALALRNGGGMVILSGDRHSGGLYHGEPEALGESVWELTSSSLNFSFASGDTGEREPDPLRRSGFFSDENFGMVEIDWASGEVALTLNGSDGNSLHSERIRFR
ncbi:alkaline phosphatase family protein [Parasphingopyxis algicola]|uniref:alkaline phosphatase D family protein n=1 Tax=Parasphingopyxis algicola TaxID=2026624 RepID=UPI0015A08086|nr:alkaline phosphatase D family protein [Parasphingopyxis algicola]QLC26714.1 alkaline phosphatase family protein [Parasphingopyxis algicola]